MRNWVLLLGGMLVWAAHFFLLYTIASILPGQQAAKTLTLITTISALAADAALLWISAVCRLRGAPDELSRWVLDLAMLGAALSFVAVIWQMMPAITT